MTERSPDDPFAHVLGPRRGARRPEPVPVDDLSAVERARLLVERLNDPAASPAPDLLTDLRRLHADADALDLQLTPVDFRIGDDEHDYRLPLLCVCDRDELVGFIEQTDGGSFLLRYDRSGPR